MEQPEDLMPIAKYAELREIAPQNVYYYIRQKRLTKWTCPCCGCSSLVSKAEADRVMGKKDADA